jgi:hypothetical protein
MTWEMANTCHGFLFRRGISDYFKYFGSIDGQAESTPICELKGWGFFTLFQGELFIDVDRNISLEH